MHTKSALPLPDKFHGLTDVSNRYPNRHLNLMVNPAVREMFHKRARITPSSPPPPPGKDNGGGGELAAAADGNLREVMQRFHDRSRALYVTKDEGRPCFPAACHR
jgi:hypothetical protein